MGKAKVSKNTTQGGALFSIFTSGCPASQALSFQNISIMRKTLPVFLLGILLNLPLFAQDFYILTPGNRLSAVTLQGCEKTFVTAVDLPNSLTDIAFRPDGTLWGINGQGRIFQIDLNTGDADFAGQASQAGDFMTSLVGSQDGLLYAASDEGNLFVFDPSTGTADFLGNTGYGAAGDLTFSNGQLVMAAYGNQMVRVDLENPLDSEPILDFFTNAPIFGVVTIAENCNDALTYASSSSSDGAVYEINFETEELNLACYMDERIFGAASELEFLGAIPLQIAGVSTTPSGCLDAEGGITVEIEGGNGELMYQLDGGPFQSSPTFDGLAPGLYDLYVEDEFLCSADTTVEVEITGNAVEIVNFELIHTSCGENNGELVVAVEGGALPLTYSLDGINFQGDNIFPNLGPGIYDVTVRDNNGCTATDRAMILGSAAPSVSEVNLELCDPAGIQLTVRAENGAPPYEYQLDNGAFQADSSFTLDAAGSYQVTVRDDEGCLADTLVQVPVSEAIELTGFETEGITCTDSLGSIEVQVADTAGLTYRIGGGAFGSSPVFEGLPPGVYQLAIRNSADCILREEVSVPDLRENPVITTLTAQNSECGDPNGRISLQAEGGQPPYQYGINGAPLQTDSTFVGLGTGSYRLRVVDQAGCIARGDTSLQADCPIYVPSAFSPNGDGRNDRFEAYSGIPFQIVAFRVYNRWGGMVYEATDFPSTAKQLFWDGQYAGRAAQPGLYVYQLEAVDATGEREQLRGEILLVR